MLLVIVFTFLIIAAAFMSTYGQNTIQTLGRRLQVFAGSNFSDYAKPGGVTIDWSTVAAVSVDTTLGDDTVVKAGDKYLRYGTTLTQITAGGKYGECLTNVSDGRETVTAAVRGRAFILNETVVMSEPGSDHPAVFWGGLVFKGRLVMNGANQPTEANIETMFPALQFAADAG